MIPGEHCCGSVDVALRHQVTRALWKEPNDHGNHDGGAKLTPDGNAEAVAGSDVVASVDDPAGNNRANVPKGRESEGLLHGKSTGNAYQVQL